MRSSIYTFVRSQATRLFHFTLLFLTAFSINFVFPSGDLSVAKANSPEKNVEASQPIDPGIEQIIADAGEKYNVDPELIRLVILQESNFKPAARSRKNALGMMQTIPATAKRFGIKNVYDPRQNIEGGTRYLRWLLDKFDDNLELALAGYNAGENRVIRYGYQVPPYRETQNYVQRITAAYGKTWHEAPASQSQANTSAQDNTTVTSTQ